MAGSLNVLFEIEEFLLTFYAAGAGETAEAAVGTDDPVTGDYERDGVIGNRGGDGANGLWFVGHLGKLGVRNCLSARDLATGSEDCPAKRIHS